MERRGIPLWKLVSYKQQLCFSVSRWAFGIGTCKFEGLLEKKIMTETSMLAYRFYRWNGRRGKGNPSLRTDVGGSQVTLLPSNAYIVALVWVATLNAHPRAPQESVHTLPAQQRGLTGLFILFH